MYAKSTRPSAKREVQKERSAKRDVQKFRSERRILEAGPSQHFIQYYSPHLHFYYNFTYLLLHTHNRSETPYNTHQNKYDSAFQLDKSLVDDGERELVSTILFLIELIFSYFSSQLTRFDGHCLRDGRTRQNGVSPHGSASLSTFHVPCTGAAAISSSCFLGCFVMDFQSIFSVIG